MATAQLSRDKDTIAAEVFIAAPPARAFDAITDPKQRALWFGLKGLLSFLCGAEIYVASASGRR
jgi:uncharacterized protein YndB with AHSA1/START domain